MEFKRITNDTNGNPRYVVHFLDLLNEQVQSENFTLDTKYNLALHLAKKVGGKIYRGKDFGGGIVFQSYNIQETINKAKGGI
jgi:hypothetical protein